ncbi:SDR family NAD(P)-dependent oxidoreductase [Chitinophaga filiformis]|uniref:SDR family oxidoreductase n=1 Tax=Chitinophaga filiformis TaxID=104663 RepID=UPI001F37FC6D|nr:SDR family NAD(P)-dependent oxidoreductase [Chitinophaga filiformis]MCF6404475.1 SDR family NAD(P)-dependent oxidoreductase [Chitinophaga filiformis]
MELSKNTILITGGTSGFGFEFAFRLLELGNTVIITGRNEQKLEETKKILPGIHTIKSDVSKVEDINGLYEKVTKEFPELNMLINNAGEMRRIALHDDHDLYDLTREIEINLMGPIRMVQEFLPHLKKQQTAAILNVTSGIALGAFPIAPVYSASKSGLRSFTQCLRVQVKSTGLKVFELIAPGSTTPLNDRFRNGGMVDTKMLVSPQNIVDEAIKGMTSDTYEIFPGPARIMRILSRLAPRFMLSQATKMGEKVMSAQ